MSDMARLIFDSISTEQDLNSFIEGQIENIYVEFKTKSDHESGNVDRELQDNLSKCISGFANSDGGVLVIGVKAKNSQPRRVQPIVPMNDFEQEINSYISKSTAFPVNGVQVKSIKNSPIGGVILIHIPKSELSPHCSLKDKKYYQRIGDSFLAMEHYQLADAFGKRHQPFLIPYAVLDSDINNRAKITVTLGIDNLGRAIARFPYLKFTDLNGFRVNQYGTSGNGQFGLPPHPNQINCSAFKGAGSDVIHPRVPLDVARLERQFVIDSQITLVEEFHDLLICGEIVADQFMLRVWQIKIPRSMIQDVLLSIPGSLKLKQQADLLNPNY